MISKYLSDLGVEEKDLPWKWNPEDDRQEVWEKDREVYGFDERDTWSLDYTMVLLIYPRLKMYNEVNRINTKYHKFEYKEQILTQQECIDKIIEGFEIYLKENKKCVLSEENDNKVNDALMLLATIWHSLWW